MKLWEYSQNKQDGLASKASRMLRYIFHVGLHVYVPSPTWQAKRSNSVCSFHTNTRGRWKHLSRIFVMTRLPRSLSGNRVAMEIKYSANICWFPDLVGILGSWWQGTPVRCVLRRPARPFRRLPQLEVSPSVSWGRRAGSWTRPSTQWWRGHQVSSIRSPELKSAMLSAARVFQEYLVLVRSVRS